MGGKHLELVASVEILQHKPPSTPFLDARLNLEVELASITCTRQNLLAFMEYALQQFR
jgi:hypothetical protein